MRVEGDYALVQTPSFNVQPDLQAYATHLPSRHDIAPIGTPDIRVQLEISAYVQNEEYGSSNSQAKRRGRGGDNRERDSLSTCRVTLNTIETSGTTTTRF